MNGFDNSEHRFSDGNLINNYRMGGYLLIAIGLINLRYQTGIGGVLAHSLIIIIPGALLLGATWSPRAKMYLNMRKGKISITLIGLALVAYAVFN